MINNLWLSSEGHTQKKDDYYFLMKAEEKVTCPPLFVCSKVWLPG